MSCAYQYGVETTAQPAAMPKVSAPEAICSRPLYGVTKTSVAASRSAISSIARKRSSNSTWSSSPRSTHGLLERHPVALALAVRDVGMCPAGDHVEHVRDDARRSPAAPRSPSRSPCRRRSGRTSRAGSARPPPYGARGEASFPARARRVGVARCASTAGAPCGTTRTFSAGHVPPSTSSRRAVSVITITSSA